MFELKKQCMIEHVSQTKGSNDDSALLVHIKISVEDLPANAAAFVLRAENVEDVTAAFFTNDADQNKRFLGLSEIPIDESWEGRHQIKISSLAKLRVIKLFNIKLTPRAKGLFDAVFTATVENPPDNYLDAVSKRMHSSTSVLLEQEPELDLKQPKDKPGAEGKKPGKVKKTDGDQAALLN
jgi:hypothetical protein